MQQWLRRFHQIRRFHRCGLDGVSSITSRHASSTLLARHSSLVQYRRQVSSCRFVVKSTGHQG